VNELNSLYNLGLGTETIHDRLESEDSPPPRRYLFIGGSHAKKEGNAMADRGHEVIICAASGWRPNKTAVEEMVSKVEEALLKMTPNDVIVLHLYDNIAYMARLEEGGDLPIRQYVNGEFHVEGDLVIAGKEALHVFQEYTTPASAAGRKESRLPYPPPTLYPCRMLRSGGPRTKPGGPGL
jgi:hypothetical protein